MPTGLPQGVVMEVDNLSNPDSIGITLRKNGDTPSEMLGVAVINGGEMLNDCFAGIEKEEINFKIDKTQLPSGVSQIVLFNSKGEILCDRLIFTGKKEFLNITVKTDKPTYRPYEKVDMEISVANRNANPAQTTFSLSVRDGTNEVERKNNILTDLLLMSEIKGYVRNPSYYFEGKNDTVEMSHLDLLLMVQGWRRYSWKQMAGVENFELKYLPEQGIETHGKVVNVNFRGKQAPKPNVDVVLLLKNKGEDGTGDSFIDTFVTDNDGRFSFVSDVSCRWSMILTAKEKGKPKSYSILLDRVFNPDPKRYRYADLQISIAENKTEQINDDKTQDELEDNSDSSFIAYSDSIAKLGIDKKVHPLSEVTIKAKRNTNAQDIFQNRSTSIAYYDVASELDNMYDRGKFVGKDFIEMLVNMNKDFSKSYLYNLEWLLYKNKYRKDPKITIPKVPLFVIDYNPNNYQDVRTINLNAIKSIYVNEHESVICQWAPQISCELACDIFACVVFIETYPEGQIPVEGAKGVRKTWLEGYSPAREFYSPNYSELPPDPDFRRTLYWNPMVTPDENGKAKINFYNNSSCTNFSISAETVTLNGMIGIYKDGI